jgi:hypothetical protein
MPHAAGLLVRIVLAASRTEVTMFWYRAAAQVSRQQLANLVVGLEREPLDDLLGGHRHARRTEAALQAVMVPEGLLQLRDRLVDGASSDVVKCRRLHRTLLPFAATIFIRCGAA